MPFEGYGIGSYGEDVPPDDGGGAVVFSGVVLRAQLGIVARPRVHYQVSAGPTANVAVIGHPVLASEAATRTLPGYGVVPYGGEVLQSTTLGAAGRIAMNLSIAATWTSRKLSSASLTATLGISSTTVLTPPAPNQFTGHLEFRGRIHATRGASATVAGVLAISAVPTMRRLSVEASSALAFAFTLAAAASVNAAQEIDFKLALAIVAHAHVKHKLKATMSATMSVRGFASFKPPASGLPPEVLQFYELKEFIVGSTCTYPSSVLGQDAAFDIVAARDAAGGDFYVCDNGLKEALDMAPAVERVR